MIGEISHERSRIDQCDLSTMQELVEVSPWRSAKKGHGRNLPTPEHVQNHSFPVVASTASRPVCLGGVGGGVGGEREGSIMSTSALAWRLNHASPDAQNVCALTNITEFIERKREML